MNFTRKFCLFISFWLASPLYAQTVESNNLNVVIEANPLLLSNQGFGFNAEFLWTEHLSLGGSAEYYDQQPYNRNEVKANRTMTNMAPFVRYYVFSPNLKGPFVGFKVNLTYSHNEMNDHEESASYYKFFVAPSVHFGYRFIAQSGFTLSAYVGAGVKSANNRFPDSEIPPNRINNQDWINAQSKLNKNISDVEPDYGLTFGYEF
ncbi:MAG: DUF3575 domain-containing protein [Bdellovibrionota bacterium]